MAATLAANVAGLQPKMTGTQLTLDGTAPRFRVMEIEQGRWLSPAYGAKCAACGAWLTKWDFSEDEAAICATGALERDHRCST